MCIFSHSSQIPENKLSFFYLAVILGVKTGLVSAGVRTVNRPPTVKPGLILYTVSSNHQQAPNRSQDASLSAHLAHNANPNSESNTLNQAAVGVDVS